jgi:hypothetical protein
MTFSTSPSPGVTLQGGGSSGGGGAASLPISGNGATITASTPLIDGTQTWNNAAVTFTGAKLNITDTASNGASLLMDLQVGGASRFYVGKTGRANVFDLNCWDGDLLIYRAGTLAARAGTASFSVPSQLALSNNNPSAPDLFLTRRGAANLRLGAADAAAPVAQTLSVQSVVAGTTNTAGTNLTITGSQGTGTGAGGSLIFQVAPAGSSGSAQNALATALTINSARQLIVDAAGAANAPAIAIGTSAGIYQVAGTTLSISNNNAETARFGIGILRLGTSSLAFGADFTTQDVFLLRDAANTLALRNGANAQTFNVYNTFTDASNYEVGQVSWSTNVFTIATSALGTGTARNLVLRWSTGASITLANNSMTFSSGNLLFGTDGNRDIGSVSANRPANIYAHTAITPGRGVVVASLPTPTTGMIARVTDATAPVIGMTVVGGGAAYALVNYNGANWTVIGV